MGLGSGLALGFGIGEDLVDEEQLRCDDRRRVEHLVLDAVVVPHADDGGVHGLAGVDVEAAGPLRRVRLLQLDDAVLRVVAGVGGERLRDDE